MGVSWLFLLIIPFILIASHQAHAQSFEDQINSTRYNISLLDEKITTQNLIINDNKNFLNQKDVILQQFITDSPYSWDALYEIEGAQIIRDAAAEKYTSSRDHLKLLITERSDQYKIIKEITNEAIIQEKRKATGYRINQTDRN